jgi:hypothetical protein
MRARNLKPGIFKNELLGSADPLLSLLFEGLWCMADREGRLEDRPLRLCAEIFPYRRSITEVEMEGMLTWLEQNNFVMRYEVHGCRYIQILQFSCHQKPHPHEAASKIPEPDNFLDNQCHDNDVPRSVRDRTKVRARPASSLNPSSLNPHSLNTANGADLVLHESLPKDAWEEWLQYRRARKLPNSHMALSRHLKILVDYDTETQRRIIDTAIGSNWKGVFHPKGTPAKAYKPAPTTAELEALELKRAGKA